MPICKPADHEKTHVAGAVGGDFSPGPQAHVGDAPVTLGHTKPDIDDLQQDRAIAAEPAETRTGDAGGE